MMNENSKIEKKRISILGCGWLGLPLAKRLLSRNISSYVQGSTTSPAKLETLRQWGIKAYQLSLNPDFTADEQILTDFFQVDSLVISLPPRLSQTEAGHYQKQVEAVVKKIQASPIKEVIFFSSTGVYPDLNRIMTEQDVLLPGESAIPEMVIAENLLIALRPERNVTILRLAGLIGYDRIPGKYVQGKKEMTTGALPVNYIHPEDAVNIIATLLSKDVPNETFNVVAPLHPTRQEVYQANCAEFGWDSPTFLQTQPGPDFKIISGEKLARHYPYTFQFPDPLHFQFGVKPS